MCIFPYTLIYARERWKLSNARPFLRPRSLVIRRNTWSADRPGIFVDQPGICAAQMPSMVCIEEWWNGSVEQGISCLAHLRREIDLRVMPSRRCCHRVLIVGCCKDVNGQPLFFIRGASQIVNTLSGIRGNNDLACSTGFIVK